MMNIHKSYPNLYIDTLAGSRLRSQQTASLHQRRHEGKNCMHCNLCNLVTVTCMRVE